MLGTVVPKDKIIVTEQYVADPLLIRGRVFTKRPNDPCDVAVAFQDSATWQSKNTLTVGKVEISGPKPAGKCYMREISIPIALVPEGLAKLDGVRTTQLTVTVTRGDQKETYSIPFEVTKSVP